MSKEQIEEMVKIIDQAKHDMWVGECPTYAEHSENIAKYLYNAGYRKQEWISVEERLPENYEKHLLLLDNGRITIGWYHESAMNFVEDGFVIVNRVTHWMPLPIPPKGGEGK